MSPHHMSKRFQRVAVLRGGPSSEREVSLRSGAAIGAALRGLGYDVADVDVRGLPLLFLCGFFAYFFEDLVKALIKEIICVGAF